jgi:hypothetical protein
VRCDNRLPICERCEKGNRYCDRSEHLDVKHYDPDKPKLSISDGAPRDLLHQKAEIAQLFHVYIRELAPWYDLNDESRAFEKEGAEMALDSPLLFSAAIAFAGIYQHRKTSFPRAIAESFHARCLNILINLTANDAAIKNGTALASTCLLRSYEIMAEEEDPNRHLFGASTLVPAMPALTDHSLLAGGFWNYLREDISYSLFYECPLKIQIDQVFVQAFADDEFANSMTILLGRTVNAFFNNESAFDILPEIREWRTKFEREPFSRIEGGVFPAPKMLKDCQVAALHYYYVARCMLEPENRSHHAAEIVGLAIASESGPVWVNAYGPICFSGQYLMLGEQRQTVRQL